MERKKGGKRLQSISLENLSGRPKIVEVDPEVTAFFQILQKSIDRISKDLQEQKKTMNEEEIEKIEKKFNEFKKLLEVGYMKEDILLGKKKSSFWARIVSIFNETQLIYKRNTKAVISNRVIGMVLILRYPPDRYSTLVLSPAR
jgi:hypothetical protein